MSIVFKNVSKSFNGRPVFSSLDQVFEDGKHYVITGPSGSGKTTLLRLAAGLILPDKGTVTRGEDDTFSMVFQEDRLIGHLTAFDNIRLGCRGVKDEVIFRSMEDLLPEEDTDKPVRELSGGQRRRVAVLRACLYPGKILIMDEPLSGLDENNARNVIEYIKAYVRGKTLIVSSHDLRFKEFCEEIRLPLSQ
ncbi:MAG TPA: hypothetical protein DCW41_01820 [Clostridiales bacterium]|nr:hypothetical protein [Clostridiales bacterium]